jgi:hypothetical protein
MVKHGLTMAKGVSFKQRSIATPLHLQSQMRVVIIFILKFNLSLITDASCNALILFNFRIKILLVC